MLAQALILALWLQDWSSGGTQGIFPERILIHEASYVVALGLPAALLVGVADGRGQALGHNVPLGRTVAQISIAVLVVLLAAWISGAALYALNAGFDPGTQSPPALVRVFVLVVAEMVFAVEPLTALLTSRYLERSG